MTHKLPSLTFKRTGKPGAYRVADRFDVFCKSRYYPGYGKGPGEYGVEWHVFDSRGVASHMPREFKSRDAAKRFMAIKLGLIVENEPPTIVERLIEEIDGPR